LGTSLLAKAYLLKIFEMSTRFTGIVFIFLLSLFSVQAFSQEENASCEQTLNQASAEFDAGRFFGLATMLNECLNNGFTKSQRFRAYYILTQSYLVLDDPTAAEESYLKLLSIDPEFKPNEANDPIDLVYLSRKFTSRPRFTPHVHIGANGSFPRSIYNISTYSTEVSSSNTLKVGYQLGVGIDFNINDKWSIGTELNYSNKSFNTTTSGIASDDISIIIDRSNWLDIPLYVKFSDDSGKWRPFGYAGFAVNLFVASSVTAVFDDNKNSGGTKIAQGPDLDLGNKRNFFNRSLLVGGGMKYKIGKNFFFVDARYMFGLNNITNPNTNYYNSDGLTLATSIVDYQYVSDFFRLDNLSLSVGYIYPLYNPRKIKSLDTKSFFKNLFKPKRKKE
jgi:Outer membrane protein beta-barrel domain